MNIKVLAPPGTKPSLLAGCYAIIVYDKQRRVKNIPAIITDNLLEFPFEPDHNLINGIIIVTENGEKLIEIKVGEKDITT